MLFEQNAAACLLFDEPAQKLPFQLKGTYRPLQSLRQVIDGKAAGAVLDGVQYKAVKALDLFDKLKIIHTSRELPSESRWFGSENPTSGLTAFPKF